MSQLFSNFHQWWQYFYGPNGLINFGFIRGIQDGNETLDEIDIKLPILGTEDFFAFGFANDLPIEVQNLANWVGDNFGSVLVQQSCAFCQSHTMAPQLP